MSNSDLADFWVCPRLDLNDWPLFQLFGAVEDTCSACLSAVVRQDIPPAGVIGPNTKVICLVCCATVLAEAPDSVDEILLSDW